LRTSAGTSPTRTTRHEQRGAAGLHRIAGWMNVIVRADSWWPISNNCARRQASKDVCPDNRPTGLYHDRMVSAPIKAPEATRKRILEAAFAEFYEKGFQGGSLNHVVETAGTKKGALFHHFDGKRQLGYAVVDHIVGPLLLQRWLEPLAGSSDPIADLQRAFRLHVDTDVKSGHWLLGCPLNNLAQEMSPLDEGFQRRINGLYDTWRARFAAVIAAGVEAGNVRKDVDPARVAALLVAAQMGIWGTGKSSQRKEVMLQATDAVCEYLYSLRP
jgi:TetR/AcrR family transcriptional regulator, transcriptional repressor for nem operon